MKNTSLKILDFIKKHGQASPKDLYNITNLSPRAIFKQLKSLSDKNIIQRIGQPPKVYYKLSAHQQTPDTVVIDHKISNIIDQNFYNISPLGEELVGLKGFEMWCTKQDLNISKTANEYVLTLEKYHAFKKNHFIDGMNKITTTFKHVALDKIFYLDFYAIERFGKTKLGQMLLLAKSNQNKKQIRSLIATITPAINEIINKYHIDAIGFIPPTVKREVQFINELKRLLHTKTHLIPIIKPRTPIMVAQKTLNKLQDRIDNARQTIIVENTPAYNNILLIDDAVGSGATLNETAQQIKNKNLCKGQIIGLAIVGSFKGFDVISEV